ncbi:hypothetical protein X975_24626, partial [Stegodyphus mimosarum]
MGLFMSGILILVCVLLYYNVAIVIPCTVCSLIQNI